MEFVSQGKLLSYLRKHRDDYLDVINDYNSVATTIKTHYNPQHQNRPFINNNNNYMTYHNNDDDGYGKINRKSFSKSMNKQQNNQNYQSLSSYDLIHFAYQISKGMEFISSHGVSSYSKKNTLSLLIILIQLNFLLFKKTTDYTS